MLVIGSLMADEYSERTYEKPYGKPCDRCEDCNRPIRSGSKVMYRMIWTGKTPHSRRNRNGRPCFFEVYRHVKCHREQSQ